MDLPGLAPPNYVFVNGPVAKLIGMKDFRGSWGIFLRKKENME